MRNDRDFCMGDIVHIICTDPKKRTGLKLYMSDGRSYDLPSGATDKITITHVDHGGADGIERGYCLISFRREEPKATNKHE